MPSPASASKTRAALIAVAQDCLAAGNLEISVSELTNRAGVSVGSLYSHFRDKRELFELAGAETIAGFLPALDARIIEQDDPALGLLLFMIDLGNLPDTDPRSAAIIVNSGLRAMDRVREYSIEPSTAIRRSVTTGARLPLDAEAYVIALVGAFSMMLARQTSAKPTPDLAHRVALMFAGILGYTEAELEESVIKHKGQPA